MFSRKKSKMPNERILYESRPNMIIGCKKVIWGIVVLGLILYVSGPVKSAIIGLQTYYISFIKFGIMGYVALAFIVLILLDIIYIIWQLLSWYSTVYTITNERIIIKKGVLSSKKTYMPFRSIQDIDLSQNILEKIINVGSVSAYSAYDNNNVKLAYISNPSEVEDLLFKKINEEIYGDYNSRHQIREENNNNMYYHKGHSKRSNKHRNNYNPYPDEDYYTKKYERQFNEFEDNYNYGDYDNQENYTSYPEDYNQKPHYDEDSFYPDENYNNVPKRNYNKYEYEEYPNYDERKKQKYDYEYYDDSLEDNINHAINNIDNNNYNQNEYDDDELYYNDEDYEDMEDFYNNNRDEIYVAPEEESDKETKQSNHNREEIVKRHFDKFNR